MGQPLAKSTCCLGRLMGIVSVVTLLQGLPGVLPSLARRSGAHPERHCACAHYPYDVTAWSCDGVRSRHLHDVRASLAFSGDCVCARCSWRNSSLGSGFRFGDRTWGSASDRKFVRRRGWGGASESTGRAGGQVWAGRG